MPLATQMLKLPAARRRGAALLLALFVMAVCCTLVISIVDIQTLAFSSLRNTMDYDRARYLAEAGLAHALAILEQDFNNGELRGTGIPVTEFPAGSGNVYTASAVDLADGTVRITGAGTAGPFTRQVEIIVKMGG